MERHFLKKPENNLVGFNLEIDAQSEENPGKYLEEVKQYLEKGNYQVFKTLKSKYKEGLYRIHVIRRT